VSANRYAVAGAFLLLFLAPVLPACSSSSSPAASRGDRDATSDAADGSAATGDGDAGVPMDADLGDGDSGQPIDSSADGDAADLCRMYGLQVPGPGDTCATGWQLTCSAYACHYAGYCGLQGYPCPCCGPSSILREDGGDASPE